MFQDVEMLDSPADSEEQFTSSAHKSQSSDRSTEKCDECRRRKKKCLPADRSWPEGGKCEECKGAGLSCGPNTKHRPTTDGGHSDTDIRGGVPKPVREGSTVGHISESQWNQVKDAFAKLYMQESLPLKKVMDIMQESHSFYATKKQWQGRIGKWGLKKYRRGLGSHKGTGSAASSPPLQHVDLNRRSVSSSVEPAGTSRMLPPNRRFPFSVFGEAIYSPGSSTGRSPSIPASARNQQHNRENFVLVTAPEMSARLDYTLLPSARSIRLLTLQPGNWNEPIQASLVVVDLENASPYEALSYCWGESMEVENIIINNSTFQVKQNLEEALRHLRHQAVDRRLWIDAICINQEDIFEKNTQALLMREIYAGATSVMAWLGSETAEISAAIVFAQKCAEMDSLEQVLRTPASFSIREGFRAILRMPWFRRIWVVQEMTFARSGVLYCGRSSISWAEFMDALEVIMTFRQSTDTNIIWWTALGLSHEFFEEVSNSGAMQLISVTRIVARRYQIGKISEAKLSLEILLDMCRLLEADDPRDKIYALMFLTGEYKADDNPKNTIPALYSQTAIVDTPSSIDTAPESTESLFLVIDYHKSVSTLYREVVEFVVRTSKSIDIICRPWAPRWPGHPTWISTLDKCSFRLARNGVYTRFQADALVGEPGQVSKTYNASSSTNPTNYRFGKAVGDSILRVQGFLLDKIGQVASVAIEGCIPADWLDLGASNWDVISMLPPEPFWRTLVADRGNTGKNAPPPFFARACRWAFNKIVPGGDLNTKQMLGDSYCPPYIAPFLRRVQAVIWKRRLFVTEKGHIGIGPEQIQCGDSVYILLGCSVPVVLRKIINEKNHYHVIGDSYVHDMMDGEACRASPAFSELWLR